MNVACDVDSALEGCRRAEFRRVDRVTRGSSTALSTWERFHRLRDPFYLRAAWCNGRFHFYEAKIGDGPFEKVTTDCPKWKPGAADVPRET